jgi:molybdopterin molybdotransferase
LNGACIGALAELGVVNVPVRHRPQVAILATGDELVPIEETPGPGQIRNSNESMLAAQVTSAGGIAVPLGIARDDRNELRVKIQQGLQFDILVLSGGVSAGMLDLVPSVLSETGVREIFHKVEMKPGKPVWFGRGTSLVFGLPGNPVSSLVCFELFTRTAIRRMMGVDPATPQPVSAAIEHDYSNRNDRPTYHPARLAPMKDGMSVKLVPWHGSSDLCGTVTANGMAVLPVETRELKTGDDVETFRW